MTFEEAQDALDELIEELPDEIFKGLNCGVALRDEVLHSSEGLLILGRYHFEPYGLGRYVTINYGSLMQIYGHLPAPEFREKIKGVLHHELTHHLEHLAGDRSLERKDAEDVSRILNRRRKKQ